MHKVILPKEWNSPDEPPCHERQVLIKYGRDDYGILWFDQIDREWCETLCGDPAFEDNEEAMEAITGWAEISHQ